MWKKTDFYQTIKIRLKQTQNDWFYMEVANPTASDQVTLKKKRLFLSIKDIIKRQLQLNLMAGWQITIKK